MPDGVLSFSVHQYENYQPSILNFGCGSAALGSLRLKFYQRNFQSQKLDLFLKQGTLSGSIRGWMPEDSINPITSH